MSITIVLFMLFNFISYLIYFGISPAIVEICSYLKIGSHIFSLYNTLYCSTLAISSIFFGYILPIYGIRKISIVGISIYIFGLFIAINCDRNPIIFGIGRIISGIGEGFGIICTFTSIRNTYTKEKAIKYLSVFNILLLLSSVISPIIFGYSTKYFGWTSIFIFAILLSSALFILFILFIKNPLITKKENFSIIIFFQKYLSVFREKLFFLCNIILFCTYLYESDRYINGCHILISSLNLSTVRYGFLMTNIQTIVILSYIINIFLLKIFSRYSIILFSICLIIINSIFTIFFLENFNLTAINYQIMIIPESFCRGLLVINLIPIVLYSVPKNLTSQASAIMFVFENFATFGAVISGFFINGTLIPCFIFTTIVMSIALILYLSNTNLFTNSNNSRY